MKDDEKIIDDLINQLQIRIDNLECLKDDVNYLRDELDKLKEDIEENYELKKRNPYAEYDIREDDFH